jgi:formyl-CoA transferase
MEGALHGIRILDLSRVLAGPFCTMLLGDLGADIIKVEEPTVGDATRQWGPPYLDGQSAYFLGINRNKQSVTLDLKRDGGRQVLLELVAKCDVVIENFRVGTMERLGLGYDNLRRVNKSVIYCSITGFGRDGPYRELPGYDPIVEALGGLMSITGPPEGMPQKVGVAIIDVLAGVYCSTGILAALRWRERTGEGQRIDVSLLDTEIAALANVASSYLISGELPARYGNDHANIAPFGAFQTRDGYVMLTVGNEAQWQRLCKLIERDDMASSAEFRTNEQRVANRNHLTEVLSVIFRGRTSHDWFDTLMPAGVPVAPIQTLDQVFADAHVVENEIVEIVRHSEIGEIPMVRCPIRMSASPPQTRRAPPLLGEDTEGVLSTLLGYSSEKMRALETDGVTRPRDGTAPAETRR